MGIPVGTDAHDLGIGHGSVCAVLDGRAFRHQCWDAVEPRVGAVRGNLLGLPRLLGAKAIKCIMLHFYRTVDSQPVQIIISRVDIDFSHCFIQR